MKAPLKLYLIEEIGNATEHLVLSNTEEGAVTAVMLENDYSKEDLDRLDVQVLRDTGMYLDEERVKIIATLVLDDDILFTEGKEINLRKDELK